MSIDSYLYCNFVKAKKGSSNEIFRQGKEKHQGNQGTLSGSDAKQFYDTLVSTPHENVGTDSHVYSSSSKDVDKRFCAKRNSQRLTRNKHRNCYTDGGQPSSLTKNKKCETTSRQMSKTKDVSSRIVNKYLQYAQEGNLNELQMLLEDGKLNIDVTDPFGWTAIMCAAYGGHKDTVAFLLSHGASWKDMKNSNNQTVLDLLNQSKHQDIIDLLVNWDSRRRRRSYRSTKREDIIPFWCDVCKRDVKEEHKKHLSSTSHLFNCQHKPKETYFTISTNNPGYKMMVKSGWDDDKGLGPEGEGRKYPIKTILKRDRYGLGNIKSSKPRVTHFGPNDESAIKKQKTIERKESQRTLTKKQKRIKESKEKAWERNLRLYMNS